MNKEINTVRHGPALQEEREFGVYTDMADFPVSESPAYLEEAVGGVCAAGSAVVRVAGTRSRITPGAILILFPWQLVSIREVSADFRMTFFRVSQSLFTDTLSSLGVLRTGFFFFMRKRVVTRPDEAYIGRFRYFCNLLTYRSEHVSPAFRRESVMQLLRVFYWDVCTGYGNDPSEKNARHTHTEELAFRFIRMIIDECSRDKGVAYYAERLKITPKYLTRLVRKISGRTAYHWIVSYTVIEIKALLRESSTDLKTIASRVGFPDQSSFSRFFRRHAGMTPSQYRETVRC